MRDLPGKFGIQQRNRIAVRFRRILFEKIFELSKVKEMLRLFEDCVEMLRMQTEKWLEKKKVMECENHHIGADNGFCSITQAKRCVHVEIAGVLIG